METFKITKKELIELCLNSEFNFNTQSCYPEYVSQSTWDDIHYYLETRLTIAGLKRNLATIEDINSIYSFENLQDVCDEFDLDTEIEAVEMLKTLLVQETLNNFYNEVLRNKLVTKTGIEYVPETLSICPTVTFLGTEEALEFVEIQKIEKQKYDVRPYFTKEMMICFINSNRNMISESLTELEELKSAENKEVWQVKANALVQKVSYNDFRVLKWKDVYNLIKNTIN